MLDFVLCNTVSTQTSNVQFAEMYMLLEVLSLEIYPNVTNSFPSVPHVETDRQPSICLLYTSDAADE